MTKSACAPVAGIKFVHNTERNLLDRDEHHLGDALARLNLVALTAAVPAGNVDLALVVGIDQTSQVTQHEAVFVPEARTRQQNGSERRVRNMNRHAGRYQNGIARLYCQRLVYTGAHIESGGTISCIMR